MSGSIKAAFNPNSSTPLFAQYAPPPTYTNYWTCCYSNGADVGSRVLEQVQAGTALCFSPPLPGPGTYTLRAYSAATGGTLLYESASFVVPGSGAEAGTLSGVPTTGTAGAALASGGAYTLQNATNAYIGLWDLTTGAYQGALVAVSGASGSVPSFTPAAAGSYQVQLCADSAGAAVLATSATITVGAAQQGGSASASFSSVPSTGTAGQAITGIGYTSSNVATLYYTTSLNGTESGRAALSPAASGTIPSYTPASSGSLDYKLYSAANGGSALATSSAITVSAAAEAGSMSGVPTSGSATVPLTGGSYTLQNGTSAYVGLYNVTTAAYQGSLVAVSGVSGNLPSFTPSVADTYAYQLTSDSAGANVLAISPNITVGAAPDVVLTGLPSSIAAGQPLTGVTFTTNNSAYGDFVLWDQTAGAIDGLALIADTVTPDNTLGFLVPQNAGHSYTVRLVSTTDSTSVVWESAAFSVTAAPGALPAQVSGFTTSGATTTQVTLNWSAVSGATGYQVLARAQAGSKWGSLADTVVSGTSYTFTGLAANEFFFPIVTAINANGRGPAASTTAGTASS